MTPKELKAILVISSALDSLDESIFVDAQAIHNSMKQLFSHLYTEQIVVIAIAASQFWPLLLPECVAWSELKKEI